MEEVKLDMQSIREFQEHFEAGTIYLVLKNDVDGVKYNEFIYCMDTDDRLRSSCKENDTVFYIFGRRVLCDTIESGPFVDGVLNWRCKHITRDKAYRVEGTAFNIKYDAIENFLIRTDNSMDTDYVFVPVYKLNKLQQAYFMVEEDKYIKEREEDAKEI